MLAIDEQAKEIAAAKVRARTPQAGPALLRAASLRAIELVSHLPLVSDPSV
jgi:hypothetical protein